MLLAEGLLLLLTDDVSGKLAAASAEVDVALGGALLLELGLMKSTSPAPTSVCPRGGCWSRTTTPPATVCWTRP